MKIKIFIISSLMIFIIINSSFGLTWKILHTQADDLDLNRARQNLEDNPDSLEYLYVLGIVYFNEYQHLQAKKVFEKMQELSPGLIEAQWGIAEVLRREYQMEQSQNMLAAIIRQSPDFFPAYISLSYIKFNLKDYKEAVRLSEIVIRKGKQNADRHTLARAYLIFAGAKGMIAYGGGPLSKFLNGTPVFTNIKRARTLMPDSAEVYYGLGSFYLLAPGISGQDIDEAQKYLEKTIATDPNITDAYVRLAQVYKLKGDREKFNFYLNLALTKEPQNFLANDIKNNTCDFICVEPE
ncbi:MAG: hypothetical protein ABIG64_00245 [Candidatus Omnitrophota bacterium]